mmetsp:Transcript_83879/g.234071  ORF Transcript_83879/g.234071 Transcript_83879/m.234071 type:complete len:499 (-) Transcript_83879:141-1637(-)
MSFEDDTLKSDEEWGSIDEVVNEPPIDVKGDEGWCSCIGFYLTCICNVIQGCFGGCCQCIYVCFSIGGCFPFCCTSCCSVLGSKDAGRPCWMSFVWWRYAIAALLALVRNKSSRLGLFMWEWAAFGHNAYWYHSLGPWCHRYTEVDEVLRSNQDRKAAFGCMNAPVPDLFATNILIFLSNTGSSDSEWAAVRTALHNYFLSGVNYEARQRELPGLVASDWPDPSLEDMNNLPLVRRAVCKCVFFVMFGQWISDEEAEVLTGWRSLASTFVLPRLFQRILCNMGISKVKKLREGTVDIIEQRGLKQVFIDMNNSLPPQYRREPAVKLCDEIMYVIGFAGMGGTSACVETCGQFLQLKTPPESASDRIDFGDYTTIEQMIQAFRMNPIAYMKESCRLDPPVTSATHAFKEDTEVELAGTTHLFKRGSLSQYVVSMANRDEDVFPYSSVFDPARPNLSSTLTWNGAFGDGQDDQYPRICPGRYLALEVSQVILSHAISDEH